MWHPLSDVQALEHVSAKAFEVQLGENINDIFLVKNKQEQWFAYRNHCPHQGLYLNWNPDQFLDEDESFIVCSMHLALFTIEQGECVHGPCLGQKLKPLPLKIENALIWVDID